MTPGRRQFILAFGSLVCLGEGVGALLHPHALNAFVWAVVLYVMAMAVGGGKGRA